MSYFNIDVHIFQIENMGTVRKLCGTYSRFPTDAPASLEDRPSPLHRFRSENNSMTIRFVSDYSNDEPHRGFKAHYVVQGS